MFVNMTGMQLWKGSKYSRISSRFLRMQPLRKVLNMPQYGWIMPYVRVLNMPGEPTVLNMLGPKIYPGSKHARVTQGAEYASISLNMP